MSERHEHLGKYDHPAVYEIRVKGHLDDWWAERFEGMSLTRDETGVTRLSGPVVDQAMLHGFLRTVRNLGLPLLSVTVHDPADEAAPDVRSGDTTQRPGKEEPT